MSWHPDLSLDALMGQRAISESQLQAEADRIAARASYIAGFAFHDEFRPERAEDSGVVPADDYGLLLDDPEGSSEETDVYRDADVGEEDIGTSADPGAARSGGGNA